MAFNKKFNKNNNSAPRLIVCSCGNSAKLCSRKNYPFGKKSKAITSQFYRCSSCNKVIFAIKDAGGKK
jgi:hypothetical protein